MHFDTALNVLWALLALLALGGTLHRTRRRNSHERNSRRWLHIVGVGLILATLFPYISATDDALRIDHFHAQNDQSHSGKQTRTDNLMRLYQAMDTPLVCRIAEISLALFLIALVFSPSVRLIERIAPLRAGRSPPAPLVAN